MFDLIIKDGTICDGTETTPFLSDIGIKDDRIILIQKKITEVSKITINAKNFIVSPGFVDVHSHSDFYLLINPLAESKIRQGVTTEIGGNCGYSPAPMAGQLFNERKDFYKKEFDIELDFNSFDKYFSKLLRNGTSVNFATQIGHNTLRASVMGHTNHPPSPDQIARMSTLIDQSMQQGVVGMSLGLIYPPSCYSNIKELIELCSVSAKRGGVLSTHIRSEGKKLIEAIKEVIEISKKAEIPLQISHLKTSGKKNWKKIDEVFELIETAKNKGLDITCDRYPYTASNTGLISALPEWVYEGGIKEQIKRLKDKTTRKKIMEELDETYPSKNDWKKVMVSQVVSSKNKQFEGKTVFESANILNKQCKEFVMDLLLQENTHVEAIYFTMSEDNLERILHKPYVMIGSDSGARADYGKLAIGTPHPRTFGTFPKVLKNYVVDKKLLTLSSAIKKMTSDPCKKFKIKNRGKIKNGMYADFVIFDINEIKDNSAYESPFHYPSGIKWVIVNGKITLNEKGHTGKKAGQTIRNNGGNIE